MQSTPLGPLYRWVASYVSLHSGCCRDDAYEALTAGWRETLILLRYGQKFREYRRYFHQLIGSKASMDKFLPIEEYETAIFLQRVAAKPEALSEHVRR